MMLIRHCSSVRSDGSLLATRPKARKAPNLVIGRSICAASRRQIAADLRQVGARVTRGSLGGDGAVAE
eukprot:6023775-Pyramimonas_sp.AAC.1